MADAYGPSFPNALDAGDPQSAIRLLDAVEAGVETFWRRPTADSQVDAVQELKWWRRREWPEGRESGRCSVNQLINVAVAEKVSALRTEEYFAQRAAKRVIKQALQVLKRAGKGNPAIPGDVPVPKRVHRRR